MTKDVTPPSVAIYAGSNQVANNSYVNKDVKFIFNEIRIRLVLKLHVYN